MIVSKSGYVSMEQALPELLGLVDSMALSSALGLPVDIVESTGLPIEIVSTGLADIIVPLPPGALDQLNVNENALIALCKKHQVIGLHAFELYAKNTEVTASCRNFAPLVGISEESATGSSNGALACYLTKYVADRCTGSFVFEQGRAMHCLSRISASIESNEHAIVRVMVGGVAEIIGRQTLSLE